jgi:hypothetical protein
VIVEKEARFAGDWWRANHYELDAGRIIPAAKGKFERYGAWKQYAEESSKKVRGGVMLSPPYVSLVDLADAHQARTEWGIQLARDPKNSSISRWCSQNGLLGLFLLKMRQMVLYPRWELPTPAKPHKYGAKPEMRPLATQVTYFRDLTSWRAKEETSSKVIQALALPSAEKPIGSLVPEQYWDSDWEHPHALIQDVFSGKYLRSKLAAACGDYFPSVPDSGKETFPYPLPTTDEFWRIYSEDQSEFLRYAYRFAKAVRAVGRIQPTTEMTDPQKHESVAAITDLGSLAGPTWSACDLKDDGNLIQQLVPTSLISTFANMALLDSMRGLVNVCDGCDRVFVSSAGRARFCSARCRKTVLQRGWRARKGETTSKATSSRAKGKN